MLICQISVQTSAAVLNEDLYHAWSPVLRCHSDCSHMAMPVCVCALTFPRMYPIAWPSAPSAMRQYSGQFAKLLQVEG